MCTSNCKKKVKSYDSFGAPIGVTFNGDADYKTTFGGFVTVFLVLLMGGNFALSMLEVLTSKHYTSQQALNYVPVSRNIEEWTFHAHN